MFKIGMFVDKKWRFRTMDIFGNGIHFEVNMIWVVRILLIYDHAMTQWKDTLTLLMAHSITITSIWNVNFSRSHKLSGLDMIWQTFM